MCTFALATFDFCITVLMRRKDIKQIMKIIKTATRISIRVNPFFIIIILNYEYIVCQVFIKYNNKKGENEN